MKELEVCPWVGWKGGGGVVRGGVDGGAGCFSGMIRESWIFVCFVS